MPAVVTAPCPSSGVLFTTFPSQHPAAFCARCQTTVPITAAGEFAPHPDGCDNPPAVDPFAGGYRQGAAGPAFPDDLDRDPDLPDESEAS